jgi:hypothetical protein
MSNSTKKRTRTPAVSGIAANLNQPSDFIALCSQDGISSQIPNNASGCKSFLAKSQIVSDVSKLTKQSLREMVAALVWARHHLDDPAEWESLDQSLRTQLTTLYSIPKPQKNAPQLSVMERLAQQVQCFMTPPPSPRAAPQQAPVQAPINVARPEDLGVSPSLITANSTASSGMAAQQIAPSTVTAASSSALSNSGLPFPQLTWLPRQELSKQIPPTLFHALDLSRHLPPDKKYHLLKVTNSLAQSGLNDDFLHPAFSHHASLQLNRGDDFDPLKRGRVLADAVRWSTPAAEDDAMEAGRRILLLTQQKTWRDSESFWSLPTEVGDSVLTALFKVVQSLFKERAAKAAALVPPCSELAIACQRQSEELPKYRAQIAAHLLNKFMNSPQGGAALINRAWLSFLYPVFHQEIFALGTLDDQQHESLLKEILNRSSSSPSLPQLPPPPPPPYYPGALHPPYQPVGGGQGRGGGKSAPFVGLPISASIVGTDRALSGVRPPPSCLACPGPRLHESFECPIRYARLLREPCPGFDAVGNPLPTAWAGTCLTATTRVAWHAYIARHRLQRSKHVSADVVF